MLDEQIVAEVAPGPGGGEGVGVAGVNVGGGMVGAGSGGTGVGSGSGGPVQAAAWARAVEARPGRRMRGSATPTDRRSSIRRSRNTRLRPRSFRRKGR